MNDNKNVIKKDKIEKWMNKQKQKHYILFFSATVKKSRQKT